MKETFLLKIALITSLIGIVGLLFVMQSTELEESSISDLDLMLEGEGVKIIGVVEKTSSRNGITILYLSQKETIKATIFDEINISIGEKVELIGEITEYKGQKEITVDKLTKDMKK